MAIGDDDAADTAAFARDPFGDAPRGRLDVAKAVRLHGQDGAARLRREQKACVLPPVPASTEQMPRVGVDDFAGLGRIERVLALASPHVEERVARSGEAEGEIAVDGVEIVAAEAKA